MEIIVTNQGPVATVLLNRPDVRNSFNPQMIEALTSTFKNLGSNKSLRAVVLKGAGSVFCAGADLNWMQSMVAFDFSQNQADAKILHEMFATLANCPWPLIGQAHGAAFGGALGLLSVCDYVVAESKTQFCFSEVKLGIAPAVISPFVLQKCSSSKVRPYLLNGVVMSAETAMRIGLVDQICAGEGNLQAEVDKFAQSFIQVGPKAVQATKKLLKQLPDLDFAQQRELTTQIIAELRVSPEGQEGLKSFLEKRKPSWSQS